MDDGVTEEIDEIEEIISGEDNNNKSIEIKEKITLPKMTNYEKCIVISERVNQLNKNAKSTIEDVIEELRLTSSIDIAIKEYELGRLPEYKVIRKYPNGNYEVWRHEEFKFFP